MLMFPSHCNFKTQSLDPKFSVPHCVCTQPLARLPLACEVLCEKVSSSSSSFFFFQVFESFPPLSACTFSPSSTSLPPALPPTFLAVLPHLQVPIPFLHFMTYTCTIAARISAVQHPSPLAGHRPQSYCFCSCLIW